METWHYLENQFDSVTKESRPRMDSILADTGAKLTAGAAKNPALAPALAVLAPARAEWDEAYTAWKNAAAAWNSGTLAMDNLFFRLQREPAPGERSLIDRWESKVSAEWAKSHPIYTYLFPTGREPFSLGTREQIIDAVGSLGTRLTKKAAALTGPPATLLADLGAETAAFHAELTTARDAQQTDEGLVDQLSTACEQRRVEAATALYRVLAKLMDVFAAPEERGQVAGFFDLALIMNPTAAAATPTPIVAPAPA